MDLAHKINALRAQPADYWLKTANQYAPTWAVALLIVALAWYGARLVWAFMPQSAEFDWTVQPTAAVAIDAATSSDAVNFAAIANGHLFGVAGAEPVTPVSSTADAPETRLNLKLRGTVAADDPEVAHAIIGESGKGTDKVYFIKDPLPGGATLYEVHPDKIILNRSGTLETLRLPKLSEGLGSASPPPQQSAQRSPPTMPQPMQEALNQTGASSFTDILRPQPYMPDGQLAGYRIYPGRDRRKFASLGLRPGDLVTAINGQQLNDLQSGMSIFKGLASASELTLAIDRAGSPMVVTIDSSQLVGDTGTQE